MSGHTGHKEVMALERRLREEDALHCESRRKLEAGLRNGKEEARELEARKEGLSEEVSKLRTEMVEGERRDASSAEEVQAMRNRSTAAAS